MGGEGDLFRETLPLAVLELAEIHGDDDEHEAEEEEEKTTRKKTKKKNPRRAKRLE